jgi:hypothetical protein
MVILLQSKIKKIPMPFAGGCGFCRAVVLDRYDLIKVMSPYSSVPSSVMLDANSID